jgi:hypothetical protein
MVPFYNGIWHFKMPFFQRVEDMETGVAIPQGLKPVGLLALGGTT